MDDDEDEVRPLISFEGGKYKVDEKTAAYLKTITTPIAIVSIAGKSRTGKSFLLNTLCDSDGAFTVGETVNACTKGVHLRTVPIKASEKLHIFALDTEGISSLSANEDHDVKILTLALLLSSSFIYNSIGAIDETALRSLNLMTRVSEFVRVDATSNDESIGKYFPKFYWCLRDFSLRLENRNGVPCSPSEYLEDALGDVEVDEEERNQVRRALRSHFPRRTLVTLPRPAESTQKMTRRRMSNAFSNGMENFRSQLLREIEPLRAGQHAMTGSMFVEVCEHYAKALNSGGVPTIRDSWSMLSEIQTRDVLDSTRKTIQHELRLPVDEALTPHEVREHFTHRIDAAIQTASEQLMEPAPSLIAELRTELIGFIDAIVEQRERAWRQMIDAALVELEKSMLTSEDRFGSVVASHSTKFAQKCGHQAQLLAAWREACYGKLIDSWLPQVEAKLRERDETTAARAADAMTQLEAAQEALTRCQNERVDERERILRDAALQRTASVTTLEMQLEVAKADATEASARADFAETEAREAKACIACLEKQLESTNEEKIQVETEEGPTADAHEIDDESKAILALETANRQLQDELREITAIRDGLLAQSDQCRREREAMETSFTSRLRDLGEKHAEAVQRLRKETEVHVQRATAEAERATMAEEAARGELAKMKTDCERLKSTIEETEKNRERELRLHQESSMRSAALCEDLQVRLLEMHRINMEETRIREQDQRTRMANMSSEQLSVQVRLGEAQGEVKELKRRMAESSETGRELKRLRQESDTVSARATQMETENGMLRSRLDEAISEREKIRNQHLTTEGRRAALEREVELLRVEKSLS